MSKVTERWKDGRPKTIKSDPKNTLYPEVGKGSRPRGTPEMNRKFKENLAALFPKTSTAASEAMSEELRKFRESL